MPHTCPWWLGYFLANPLRKLTHNPEIILKPYLKDGMNALDVGPGMGFFSIPMAQFLGDQGRVYCIDLQPKMLSALKRRAAKAGVEKQIETRLATPDSLAITDLKGKIDFALAFAVVHEVSDQQNLFVEIHQALKPGGRLLVAEPAHHVGKQDFEREMSIAVKAGLVIEDYPKIAKSQAAVLRKE